MQSNGFIRIVIGVIVSIIVITAVAVPLISGMQVTTESEVENTGQESRWSQLGTDATFELSIPDATHATVNGVTVQTNGMGLIMMTDTFTVVQLGPYFITNVDTSNQQLQGTISFSGGTATITNSNLEQVGTMTYGWAMVPDPDDGDWGLFGQDSIVRIDRGTEAYAFRHCTYDGGSDSTPMSSMATFTAGDSTTQTDYALILDNVSFEPTDATCTLSPTVDGQVVEYTGTTWSPASEAISEVRQGQYVDGILAPMTYTAEVADPDDPINAMINLVPLLMVVGMVVATVAAFLTYKLKES